MKTKHLIIALALPVLAGCNRSNEQFDASGVFETTEITVSAQGSGKLISLDIEEGSRVAADSAVGLIDTVPLHLKKLELEARIGAAAPRYADVPVQLASLRQQIATLQKERTRFENLVAAKAGNQKQLDDVNAQLALAERQLAAAKENLDRGNSSLSGEIKVMQTQLVQLNDQIAKCIVTSPAAGTVLNKFAEPGELVAPGAPLFSLADISTMYLRAYITADQLTSVKLGQQVKVYADEGTDSRREYPGVISWISDEAEFTPKTIQTRNERANLVYPVKVRVANDGFIKKGMYGEIKLSSK